MIRFLFFSTLLISSISASWAVDPTRPAYLNAPPVMSPLKKTTNRFRLQQIRISDEAASAVVNEQIVYVGSHISGAKVVDITENQVVLAHQGKNKTLTLINRIKQASE